MRLISQKLQEAFSTEVTTISTCWKLKLKDNVSIGFTDADLDLEIDGMKYHANSGFYPSSLVSSSRLNEDNIEAHAILDNDLITEQDLSSGKYDNAEVMIFLVDYLEPTLGKVILRTGHLGNIQIREGEFFAEIIGLMQAFDKKSVICIPHYVGQNFVMTDAN